MSLISVEHLRVFSLVLCRAVNFEITNLREDNFVRVLRTGYSVQITIRWCGHLPRYELSEKHAL